MHCVTILREHLITNVYSTRGARVYTRSAGETARFAVAARVYRDLTSDSRPACCLFFSTFLCVVVLERLSLRGFVWDLDKGSIALGEVMYLELTRSSGIFLGKGRFGQRLCVIMLSRFL